MRTTASNLVFSRGRAHGLDSLPADEWQARAACSPVTAELFDVVPSKGALQKLSADNRAAQALCRYCPVRAACLADALGHPTTHMHIAGGCVVHLGRVIPTAAHHPPRSRESKPLPDGARSNAERSAQAEIRGAQIRGLRDAGISPRAIADNLGVSIRTVLRHVRAAVKDQP